MSDAHRKADDGNATPADVAVEFADSADQYKVKLPDFEGPLDLLLYLIRKEEVSIYDIPIARITAQYLDYLNAMRELDIAVAGEFLVMAATLIYIKSQMLLPHDPNTPEAELEDPRAELVQQLLEHQKFKGAANALHQRALIEAATFTRGPLETDEENPEVASTVFHLFEVFRDVLNRQRALVEIEIEREQVTMAEKIAEIRQAVAAETEVSARRMFEAARSKREMVLIFLAILELVKELIISLKQAETFGDILISKSDVRDRMPEADEEISEVEITETEVRETEVSELEVREAEVREDDQEDSSGANSETTGGVEPTHSDF
jgi:segregation and condensation protein A